MKLQQISIDHSSRIDFNDFMKFYKKCTSKPYSFLLNDTTLPSDNLCRFERNNIKVMIITDEKLRDEKTQYNMDREAEKTSALTSGKIDKYEYLTGKEILSAGPGQIKEQAKIYIFSSRKII